MTLPLALAFAAATSAADPAPPPAGPFWVYVGTYTGGKDGSKGIYRCEFDAKTGTLSKPELAAEVGSPSFLAIAPNGKTLYAVGEVSDAGAKKNEGGVYAFRLDPATGALAKLSDATSGGPGPCHVAVDPAGKMAVVANYGGGSDAFYKLKDDGGIAARSTFHQHTGKRTHAHCGAFDRTGNFAFVVDLGLDRVLVYKVDREAGTAAPAGEVVMPAGSGPRHIDIAKSNDLAFVNGESDLTVSVVRMDPAKGEFKVVQTVSTLPAGTPTKGFSTAEVRIHPTGKFVYVSNRGHDSIAAFKWDGQTLTPVGHATEGIKVPRNFNIDPTGKWMLVASQDGGNVAVFAIDPETGLPKPTGTKVAVSQPVCVKFLAKP